MRRPAHVIGRQPTPSQEPKREATLGRDQARSRCHGQTRQGPVVHLRRRPPGDEGAVARGRNRRRQGHQAGAGSVHAAEAGGPEGRPNDALRLAPESPSPSHAVHRLAPRPQAFRASDPVAAARHAVVVGQHDRRPAGRRRDLAASSRLAAVGGRDRRALAVLRGGGEGAVARRAPAARLASPDGDLRLHHLQRALLLRRAVHECGQPRHPARLDADLRDGWHCGHARHPADAAAMGGRAHHDARRDAGGDAGPPDGAHPPHHQPRGRAVADRVPVLFALYGRLAR